MQYQGQKFYCKGSYSKPTDDYWSNERIEIRQYAMTKTYRKYLAEKRLNDLKNDIMVLKNKLEWQYKHYGSVDDLDFNHYTYLLNQLNKMEA